MMNTGLEEIRRARHEQWLRQKATAPDASSSVVEGDSRKRSLREDTQEPSRGSHQEAPTVTKRMRLNARDGSSSSTGNLSPISTLKILSWNVDGLDSHSDEIDMTARTMSVASHIIDHRPHIVLMQELIDFNMTWLRRLLSKFYDFYIQSSPPLPYFVGILIDRSAVAVHGPLVTDNFANTKMGRALVSLDGEVRLLSGASVKVHIATAHLESTKSFGRARVDQLKESFSDMRRSVGHSKSHLAIFGGDLNIRDDEVRQALLLPNGSKKVDIIDAWEASGRPKDSEFTWDMRINDNLGIKGKPKARFDRLYLANSDTMKVSPQGFRLTGTTRCDMDEVKGKKRFPSDHFGIQLEMKIEMKEEKVIDLSNDN